MSLDQIRNGQLDESAHVAEQLRLADQIAQIAHKGQKDAQGHDYYPAHVLPISQALAPYGWRAQCLGLLHDVVEDNKKWTCERLLVEGVDADIVEAVDAISKRRGESDASYQARVLANDLARIGKLVDNTSNLVRNVELAKIKPATAAALRDFRYIPFRKLLLAKSGLTGRQIQQMIDDLTPVAAAA